MKQIKWALVEVEREKLKVNPKNPKIRNEKGMKRLRKSLEKFGNVFDGIVNADYTIIDGHSRFEVSKEKTARVFIPDRQLTEKEYTELNGIFDIARAGDIDFGQIQVNFEEFEINAEEWDIEFETGEQPEAVEDEFEIPETIKTDIALGDLFQIGEHRLLCGDSTDSDSVAKLMNGELADMVFTDPPWNVNYGAVKEGNPQGYKPRTIMNDSMSTDDFKDFMGSAFAMMAMHSKKGCPTYVVMSAQEWGNLMLSLYENGYHWSSTIIWNKSHLVMSRKDYHTKYEPIWYGWLDGAPRLCPVEDRKQSDVWDVDRPTKSELHPTTKPIALIDIALKNSSKVGNLILELFTGSGSTMVASHQLKRKCFGMEIDPKYCQVIIDRMKKLDPTIEIKKIN